MKSGNIGIAVNAPWADLAHQIHAHGVAAERKEGRMAEAQNAAVAPDQIDRQRQHRIAEILADQDRVRSWKCEKRDEAGTTRFRMGHHDNDESDEHRETSVVPESLRALIHNVYWGGMVTGSPTRGQWVGRARVAGSE